MQFLLFAVGTLAVTARASYDLKPFDNFVTFGDSYTVSSPPRALLHTPGAGRLRDVGYVASTSRLSDCHP